MVLDLKTLLLCNISSPTKDSYQKLYEYSQKNNGTAFFTLGGVDAIAVYPTPPQPDRAARAPYENNPSDQWLDRVLHDKKNVIHEISEGITYHPIHLVRYTEHEPSSHKNDKRFLLVTFVYGISDGFRSELRMQNPWTIEAEDAPVRSEACPSEAFSQEEEPRQTFRFSQQTPSEADPRVFSNQEGLESEGTGVAKPANHPYDVEIYDCINISDRVILTYTNNIIAVLDAVCRLETEGKARKTYTMINFCLSGTGVIDPELLSRDECVNGKIRRIKIGTIEKNLIDSTLSLCIRGSIRDNGRWAICCSDIKQVIAPQTYNYFINYGEADFTLSISPITGAEISDLLRYYLDNSEKLSEACWDIHSELQLRREPKGIGTVNAPPKVLQVLYEDLDKNLKQLNETADRYMDWPWVNSLKELFSAQVNIERNPVLHGPSYLLWNCFRVFNDFFATYNNPTTGSIKDIDNLSQLISSSRDSLERSIRCLSQLTDQLTRNDDIIFRGIGRIPAIATTLPENLLEFYHAFLLKVVEFLIKTDESAQYTPLNYRHSFLIAPEFNQRARICQVFNTEHWYRNKNYDKHGRGHGEEKFCSWPSEQIHIIQFPINDIFCPVQCMVPLVHECFHFFGDYLRCRRKRAVAMSYFLSELYIDAFAFDCYIDKPSRIVLSNVLASFFTPNMADEAHLFLLDKVDEADLYLSDMEDFLVKKCKKFLTDEGTKELYQVALTKGVSSDFLFYLDNIRKRASIEANFNSSMGTSPADTLTPRQLLHYCIYYFKECYADFMSIVTLKLRMDEYLPLFNSEYPQYSTNSFMIPDTNAGQKELHVIVKLVLLCQRVSIVFAALIKSGYLDISALERVLFQGVSAGDYDPKMYNSLASGNIMELHAGDTLHIPSTIWVTVSALLNEKQRPLASSVPGIFPIASLRTVVDYLASLAKELQTDAIRSRMNELQKQFDRLIRKEKIFELDLNTTFKGNDIIYNYRDKVREEANNFKKII